MLVDDLTLIKELGKGAFGKVFLTSKQGSMQKFATKQIDKKYAANPKAKRYIDNEISILKDINHENIVKLYDVKETSQYFYLVTEYCNGGALSDRLEDYKDIHNAPFPEELVQYLMRQIMSAMKYLHGKKILHRDIKLDNILVHFNSEEDKKNNNLLKAKVKMIDFGFARYLKKEELAYSILGSPINMDPGILRKLNRLEHSKDYGYDEKADIWSLGTIVYEMLIGKCTFDAESMRELVSKVEKGNYFLPSTLSKEAVSFLNGMLQYDFKKRLSAEQLYRHKFLNMNFKDLHKINLNEIKKNLMGSRININTKKNQSIWDVFGDGHFSVILEDYEGENYVDEKKSEERSEEDDKKDNEKNKEDIIIRQGTFKNGENKLSEEDLKKEFAKTFNFINDDFIYVEPKLIPIVPGDDPTVISKISEFNEENF
jgi:serine/threonine protein kinase